MRSWREYEKTPRLKTPKYDFKGKYIMSASDINKLLRGVVVITEKMDGANTGLYITDDGVFLQKRRGLADGSHLQYKRFVHEWRWQNQESIERLPKDVVVYGELMYCVHTIYYTDLPDYFLIFDIYDLKQKRYLPWEHVRDIAKKAGMHTVPHIATIVNPTIIHVEQAIPEMSAHGKEAEGVVVKNYTKQMKGKVTKHKFLKHFDESDHWMNQVVKYNRLAERVKYP